MDTSLYGNEENDERPAASRRRAGRGTKMLATAALTVGMAAGGFGIAHAATASSSNNASSNNASSNSSRANSSSCSSATRPAPPSRSAKALNPNQPGPGETLLTGDAAVKATAAAKAAVPGGTIIRVETDANQGAKYEAHMTKSDGSEVTVLMDAKFKVTSTVPFGSGAGGPHGGPNGMQPPSGAQAPAGTPSA